MTIEELRGYVEEQRNLNNIPYHVYSTLIDGIDTLEQEPRFCIGMKLLNLLSLPIMKSQNPHRKSHESLFGITLMLIGLLKSLTAVISRLSRKQILTLITCLYRLELTLMP